VRSGPQNDSCLFTGPWFYAATSAEKSRTGSVELVASGGDRFTVRAGRDGAAPTSGGGAKAGPTTPATSPATPSSVRYRPTTPHRDQPLPALTEPVRVARIIAQPACDQGLTALSRR
jgi:hypothetical protein